MSIARHDVAVELNHHSTGTNSQLIEQSRHAEPRGDFFIFAVDVNNHLKLKNRIRLDHAHVAREYGLKFVSLRKGDSDSHASLRRYYPDQVQRVTRNPPYRALSLPIGRHP